MSQHVPLGGLGSPGLPVTSYDQLHGRRLDPPWPPELSTPPGPRPRRGLLRRVLRLRGVAVGTR